MLDMASGCGHGSNNNCSPNVQGGSSYPSSYGTNQHLVNLGGLTGHPRTNWYGSEVSHDDPSALNAATLEMSQDWRPIDICVGGTDAIRRNALDILPREPREDDDAYNRRVFHAVMPPFVQRLASQAAGTILRKGVHLEGAEEWWEDWTKDVTGDGTTLNEFCRRTLVDALLFGHSAIVVDYPPADGIATLRDEVEADRKPYFVAVPAHQIRGWRTESNRSTSEVTQVRYLEQVSEPAGRFGESVFSQVRVLEKGRYEIWRWFDKKQVTPGTQAGWVLHEQGETTLDRIPMAVVYSNQIATLVSKPPLLEVANLTIAYCQRFTDYYHSLHVGAQPILCFQGFDPDDKDEANLGLSINTAVLLPPDGDAKYVAPPAEVYEAERNCLKELEEQISALGISTLAKQNITNAAAEAKRLDRVDSDSIMAIISENLATAVQELLEMAAEYAGKEAPKVSIPKDYENKLIDGNQITAMLQLQMQGVLSTKTLLRVLQEGEVVPPYVDLDEEILATQDEMEERMAQQTEQMEEQAKIAEKYAPKQQQGGVNSGKASSGSSKGSQTLRTPMRSGKGAS